MRILGAVLVLSLVMAGCSGSDGRDGRDGTDGADGTAGPAGPRGEDGADGQDGAPGAKGDPGADGTDGTNGTDGTDGADGGDILKGTGAPAANLGKDGDLYIDTVSRDVYQKAGGVWSVITNLSGGPPGPKGDKGDMGAPGADGDDGAAGASVRTGSGAPAAGLGNVGDVYIDSATGDLYSKGAGGWTKTGSLKGPAGDDGVDVKDTVGGVRWFAFALTAGFIDAPNLVTGQAFTPTSSSGSYTFTGKDQHGRLGFATAGSYLQGGVDLSAFESLSFSATVTGGATQKLVVLLTEGDNIGCQWEMDAAAGPDYSIDLSAPDVCYPASDPDSFTLSSVTNVQIGIMSSSAGARTLSVTAIEFEDTL
jgi:hypothetical protein